MIRQLNFDESNLSITMKMADLKALFNYWEDERAKKLAEADKVGKSRNGIAPERLQRFSTRVFLLSIGGKTLGIC